MAKLAHETYQIVEEYLEEIMDTKWMNSKSKLVLLGGIMINFDNQRDAFLPIKFELRY